MKIIHSSDWHIGKIVNEYSMIDDQKYILNKLIELIDEENADVVGVGRNVIVDAYQYGQGLINFITPTGLILASLALVNVTYDKWLKFVMPLIGIIAVLSVVMLGIGSI